MGLPCRCPMKPLVYRIPFLSKVNEQICLCDINICMILNYAILIAEMYKSINCEIIIKKLYFDRQISTPLNKSVTMK